MGLAASQGRLLLLTARKSDLEYQAQVISQERLLLAIQQEQIATEYSDAINNQIIQINVANGDTMEMQTLTYERLTKLYPGAKIVRDNNGTSETVYQHNTSSGNWNKGKAGPGATIVTLNSPENPNAVLQSNLLTGVWRLQDRNGNEIPIAGNANFKTINFTDDDNAAKAKYDAALARVQRLDKQLELKLNQVETQHKAVETEIESVDKIIQNNIEGSFKYFS